MSILIQAISTGIASYLCMSMGIMFTWPSSTLLLFSSTNTTLNRPMTETEVSLLGSLPLISGLISTTFVSYVMETLGRKYCCVLFSMLEVINWVIITFSYNVEAILAAIFLSGLCRCMLLVVPIYVSEICQDSIRGMMTSGAMVFHSIGMLVSYLIGGYLSYDNMNYVCLSITVLEVVFLYFLKESPMHLMRKGHKKEAAQAIAFYRGTSINSKLVEEELQKLRRALNTDLGDATPEEEKLTSELKENPKLSTWQFLKKSRSTRRALFMILVLNAAVIFQGLIVVQVYAGPLYAEAVPSMSPTICSVIFTLVTITSGFIGAFLIERAGRRIKSIASMIVIQWSLVCSFIVLFIFNPLVTAIGLGPVFYFFAFACFFSAIFCKFFLPETKGLTVDVIQILFAKRIVRRRHVVNTEIKF